MNLRPRGKMIVGLSAALLVALGGPGRAEGQDSKVGPKSSTRKTEAKERASGVILKVEKNEKDRTLRLTINTAAVWRDWARDQTTQGNSESAKKEAEAGANSVATKGEPSDKNNLVLVDLTTDSTVETRFRTLDDESSKGSKDPGTAGKKHESAKPTRFQASDLKPGLFVEADFRRDAGRNRTSTLAVIRPVADTRTTK